MVGIKKRISERGSLGAKPDYAKRPVPKRGSGPVVVAPRENDIWVLCFKGESKNLRQALQTLHVIDGATHRTVGVDAAANIGAVRIIRFLSQMIDRNGRPQAIRCEHHIELRNKAFTDWCLGQRIELVFVPSSRPD